MKRYRVKAAGLGLALWAGSLHGQDPLPPAMLPAAMLPAPPATATPIKGEPWTPMPVMPADTVWLPARFPNNTKPPAPLPDSVIPASGPLRLPEAVKPAVKPFESIPAPDAKPVVKPVIEIPVTVAPAAKPIIEVPPAVVSPFVEFTAPAANLPVKPFEEILTPVAKPTAAVLPEIPLPVAPGTFSTPSALTLPPMPEIPITIPNLQPKVDPLLRPDSLPKPRPAPVPPPIPRSKDKPEATPPGAVKPVEKERELPTAPRELMVPTGVPVPGGAPVPGKHGTFGSPAVNISKDYAGMHDVFEHDLDFGLGHLFGKPSTDNLAADRLEFRAEYLLWWTNAQKIPVLATTSTNGGFGFLGEPGTQTLLDAGSFGTSPRSGFRARAGYWFDECGQFGIDGSFFFLGNQTKSAAFDSSTTPTITRPIFAPNFPGEFGEIVAFPGVATGALTIDATSKLWGFDLNLRRALCKSCDFHSEVFAGYRSLSLNESITINEFITALPGNTNDPAGTMVTVSDNFQTRNRFNGGQVGYAAERTWNRWTLEGRGSVALGNTSQTVEIAGFQSRLRPGMTTPDTFAGGLLATGPNLGKFQQDRFSVVPEFTLNMGYWITPVIKVYAGYNFLYWSNVVRAGDQIDRVVDVTFVPNPPPGVPFSGQFRPQPTFSQSNLSVNGIQFGIMGRW